MLFGSIYRHFTFLQIATCLPGFVVKNTAVQYRSPRWEKSHEIMIKMLRVDKVGAQLTPLSERICGLKLVQIEPRSTYQKRGLCWITN